MNMNRRTFVIQTLTSSALLAVTGLGRAQAPLPKVAETDPQAVALGFKENAAKVDKAKFPKYAAGQACGNCQLYQGPAAGLGNCPLFAGKAVPAAGWCSAYAKKA